MQKFDPKTFIKSVQGLTKDELLVMSISAQDQIAWYKDGDFQQYLPAVEAQLKIISDELAERELLETDEQ